MGWFLTAPMLMMEIVLAMKFSPEESSSKCPTLGVAAAVMIVLAAVMIALGCPGELERKCIGH
jgi:hypothetical protein